jgi:hypothetical protein
MQGLAPRLDGRARVHRFRSHPGEIKHLGREPQLVRSGVSAAAALGFDLVAGSEVDAYLPAAELERIVAGHALEEVEGGANVILRSVPESGGWERLEGRRFAPEAAVALDLAEEADARSARAGSEGLKRLDRSLGR